MTTSAAREFEPLFPVNLNPMMANDFGIYDIENV
jgi:hypothetical protein